MLAQLSVYPIGEGTSLSRFVKKGTKVIKESGFTYEIGQYMRMIWKNKGPIPALPRALLYARVYNGGTEPSIGDNVTVPTGYGSWHTPMRLGKWSWGEGKSLNSSKFFMCPFAQLCKDESELRIQHPNDSMGY